MADMIKRLKIRNNIGDIKARALQGDAKALVRLGQCYLSGRMVEQDKKEAFRLFSLAAQKGYGLSCVADCYYNGDALNKTMTKHSNFLQRLMIKKC